MSRHRPTPSVTGRNRWEWNRLRTDGTRQDDRQDERGRGSDRNAGLRDRTRGNGDLQQRVEELEAELERKERTLQRVIDRYERLLAEKDRRLAAERSDSTADGLGGANAATESLPPSLSWLLRPLPERR
jgi:hypothetical protein